MQTYTPVEVANTQEVGGLRARIGKATGNAYSFGLSIGPVGWVLDLGTVAVVLMRRSEASRAKWGKS